MSDGTRPIDILAVGDADVDIYVEVPRLPQPGEKIAGTHLGLHPGGVAANFCTASSRLGLRTRLVSVVGDDPFGQMAIDDLLANGVDATTVRVVSGTPTYLSWVAIDPSGDKALTIARTSAMFPRADDVADADLRAARHVHLAPFDLRAAVAVAVRARACGATVSVDLEPASLIGARTLVEELIASTDVLLPNSHAVEAWFGTPVTRDAALELARMGPQLVAIGCGAAGSIFAASGDVRTVPALDVPVRDTTGAGDAFNAAVVWGWLRGVEMLALARFATAAAAQVIGAVGARTAQPTRDQVARLLEEYREHPPGRTCRSGAERALAVQARQP